MHFALSNLFGVNLNIFIVLTDIDCIIKNMRQVIEQKLITKETPDKLITVDFCSEGYCVSFSHSFP